MSETVNVIATFHPKVGRQADVEKIIRGMIGPTRAEVGCQRYDLYVATDGGSFVLFESYGSQAALEAHRATEHYKSYRAQIADLLSEPIKVQVINGLDVRT